MIRTSSIKLTLISIFLVVGFTALLLPRRHTMESLLARIDREFPGIPQITTAALGKKLERGDRISLFDVRTPEEYEASHLPGAILLEDGLTAGLALRRIREHPTNQVVLYCSVGYRAAEMAESLRNSGWTNATVLRGSIFQWVSEGREITSARAGIPRVHPHSISYTHLVPADQRLELPGSTLLLNHIPRGEKIRLSISVGLLVLFLVWETLSPAYRWFANPRARFSHGWRNYLLGFINVILAGLFFVQLWLFVSRWAQQHDFGLLNVTNLPGWTRILIAIILLDAWTYAWHWLNHRIGFLWRFHRTHHTEMHMDVTSAVRFHFGEIVLSGLLRVPLIALLGIHFKELLIYELLLFTTVQFHHANIRLPAKLDKLLSFIIASPGYHRVHHSTDPAESNTNFSSLLTIWDRLFGTQSANLLPASEPASGFGVSGMKHPDHHTLVAMVESPLN